MSLVFSVFLWQLVKRGVEKSPLILKAYWALEVIAIAALALNLYFGWFYSFDGDNLCSVATITSSPTLLPLPHLRSCCGCCCATTAA